MFIAAGAESDSDSAVALTIGIRSRSALYGNLSLSKGCTAKTPTGPHHSVWSSLALVNVVIDTMPSPPGRFSITTAWPQRLARRSPTSRATRSVPLAAPNGRTNFTVRCG